MDHSVHSVDLSQLPVGALVEIDGSTVCLQLMEGGALLSANLDTYAGPASAKRYLELGFSNALEFKAGLALDSAHQTLMLTHWLDGVSNWASAAPALELLLNQVDVCKLAGAEPARQAPKELSRRTVENALRARLMR